MLGSKRFFLSINDYYADRRMFGVGSNVLRLSWLFRLINARPATKIVPFVAAILACTPPSWSATDGQEGMNLSKVQNVLATDAPLSQPVLQFLADAIEKNPKDAELRLLLAKCYDRLGLPELALEQYQETVNFAPNDPKSVLALIKAQIKAGNVYGAGKLIEAAAARFPNFGEVLFWYANLMATRNQQSEAKALYGLALQKDPNLLGLPSALGELLLAEKRYGDAVRLANQDLRVDPKLYLAVKVKGLALVGMNFQKEAAPYLKLAFIAAPYKTEIAATFARNCYWNAAYVEALEPALIQLSLTSSFDSFNIENKRLLLNIIKKLPRKFIANTISTVSSRVDGIFRNAAFHFSLADVLDRADLHDLAIEQYKQGLAMTSYGRGAFRLAKDLEIYRRDYQSARSYYELASTLSPDDKEVNSYLSQLERRLCRRNQDIAWQTKDWLVRMFPQD